MTLNNVKNFGILLSKIFFLQKIFIFRCFVLCKKKWKNLINITIKSKRNKHLLLVFCLGLLNFVATTPFSFIVVLPLTFGSFFYIFEKREYSNFFSQLLTIFSFLFGYFTSIFWWLFVPLTVDLLHLFWLIPFAFFGIPFVLSIIFMIFFIVSFVIFQKIKKTTIFSKNTLDVFFIFIFLMCWFLSDYVRGHFIFGGFPWMLFGHFVTHPFALLLVRFIGLDLYSIFFLALVITPYIFLFKRENKILKNISIIIVILWILNCIIGYIYLLIKPINKLDINIFASQPNIKATLYVSNKQMHENLNKNAKILSIFSKTNSPSLMLMPEGSINFNLYSGDVLTKNLGRLVPNNSSLLLAGGINSRSVSPYNVIYAINNDGHIIDMYKKQKLVPFGEYIPFRSLLPRLTRLVTGGNFDFSTGNNDNDLFIFYKNLPIIYPIICYESIFPDFVKKNIELSRIQINHDITEQYAKQVGIKTLKERGEIIVNLTNDAWMKWSVGAYQHFLMTRFLAISTGLPVVRVSNNGFSAFIDSYGRIIAKTKLNKEDLLMVGSINK